jgi:hypothetical protein
MSMIQNAGGVAHEEKEGRRVAPRAGEVIEFCRRHAIESDLTKAEELAWRLFPHVHRLSESVALTH